MQDGTHHLPDARSTDSCLFPRTPPSSFMTRPHAMYPYRVSALCPCACVCVCTSDMLLNILVDHMRTQYRHRSPSYPTQHDYRHENTAGNDDETTSERTWHLSLTHTRQQRHTQRERERRTITSSPYHFRCPDSDVRLETALDGELIRAGGGSPSPSLEPLHQSARQSVCLSQTSIQGSASSANFIISSRHRHAQSVTD